MRYSSRCYQLAHDYLVPSLREWLTRKQKETRRGRAELCLAERSAAWNAKPDIRHLPSLWEWGTICALTDKTNWTAPERETLRRWRRRHGVRGLALGLLLAVAMVTGLGIREHVVQQRDAIRAAGLVQAALNAETAQLPAIIDDMAGYRDWVDPLLRRANERAAVNSRQKLHSSLALLPVDATQVDYLSGQLLDAKVHELPVIRDALAPHKDAILVKLWAVAQKPDKGKEEQRIRAAAALAEYDPQGEKWAMVREAIANDLVRVPAVYLAPWLECFRPVRGRLQAPLAAIFRDAGRRDAERSLATDILADYAAYQPRVLADLLMDADEKQFAVIYPRLEEQSDGGLPELLGEIGKKVSPDLPSSDEHREKLAKRQANAAVALLKMNQPASVWPLLKHSPDPRVRSYLIHRLGAVGADAGVLVKRLAEEPDVTIRRALILSLGPEEFGEEAWAPEAKKLLANELMEIYRAAADPGLHAASEWLLRSWKHEAWLKQVNEEWAKDERLKQKRIDGIKQLLTKEKEKAPPQWYVNTQGQTMVVMPGPVEFLMGSPPTEPGRQDTAERQHKRRIGRTFAVAAKAVTLEQYRRFDKSYPLSAAYSRMADLPVVMTSWYQAAAYCNWLSKHEGIAEDQWSYEIENEQLMKLRPNYLSSTGYRLPTEAEMEYATRAGAVTSRYYGETEELLAKYGWYNKNAQEQTWPAGSLKPNDLGLFDMHGNVWTWCQERFEADYPPAQGNEAIDDREDRSVVSSADRRVLRGGSVENNVAGVRSASRDVYVPTLRFNSIGFRVAKTVGP